MAKSMEVEPFQGLHEIKPGTANLLPGWEYYGWDLPAPGPYLLHHLLI